MDVPVSLVDLLPTALELGGIDATSLVEPLAGRSLIDIADRPGDFAEREVFAEYSAEAADAPLVMIRRGAYKYIQCEIDPPLLFNLESDPAELTNLAQAPVHLEERRRFEQTVTGTWRLAEVDAAVRLRACELIAHR